MHRCVLVVGCTAFAACSSTKPPDLSGDASVTNDAPPGDAILVDAASTLDAAASSSCVGLSTTCGPNQDDDCCRSLQVPGGTFYRSYDLAADPASGGMSFPATVSTFRLDKYEVTIGRFRAFLAAGMGTQAHPPAPGAGAHPNLAASGWDASWTANLKADTAVLAASLKCDSMYPLWSDAPGTGSSSNEDRPMSCITWYDAMAFCIWDGGYLPTEAEWNYAAAGGDQQRAYPWSNPAGSLTPIGTLYASFNDGTNCVGDDLPGCALTDLVVVGTKPAGNGRWGHADLGGNVWEWTLDSQANYPNPCVDCTVQAGGDHIIRGSAFVDREGGMRTGFRFNNATLTRSAAVGVRCARP